MTADAQAGGPPLFVPAYDAEQPGACLAACRRIADVHRRRGIPATFFIVGKLLESEAAAFRELLDEPELFEIASHTYSHRMLRDHPVCGRAAGEGGIREEILRGTELVEDCFGRACVGIRPGCGFERGLAGAPAVLKEVADAGLRYVSSQAWGPHMTLPAPLARAYTYEGDGYGDLWEFPAHGWHENVLKGHNAVPGRLLLWPPLYPECRPARFVETPAEEFAVHRFFIDRAVADGLEYVSLIWHPWSLGRFDPPMTMLDLVFDHVAARGMTFARYEDLWRRRQAASEA